MQTEAIEREFVRRVQRLIDGWPVVKVQQAVTLGLSVRPESPADPMGSFPLWHGMVSWRPTLTLLGRGVRTAKS